MQCGDGSQSSGRDTVASHETTVLATELSGRPKVILIHLSLPLSLSLSLSLSLIFVDKMIRSKVIRVDGLHVSSE